MWDAPSNPATRSPRRVLAACSERQFPPLDKALNASPPISNEDAKQAPKALVARSKTEPQAVDNKY